MIQLQYVHHHAKTMGYAQHPIHVLAVILDTKELIVAVSYFNIIEFITESNKKVLCFLMIQNITFMIQLQYVHHHAKTMEYAQHPRHVLVVILDMKELIVAVSCCNILKFITKSNKKFYIC